MTNAQDKVERPGLKTSQAYNALNCGRRFERFGQSLVSPWDGPIKGERVSLLVACNRVRTVTVREHGRGWHIPIGIAASLAYWWYHVAFDCSLFLSQLYLFAAHLMHFSKIQRGIFVRAADLSVLCSEAAPMTSVDRCHHYKIS